VSGDGSIGDVGAVEGVGEGMEAGVKVGVLLGVAEGPVEERLLGVDDGSAEWELVGAGGAGGSVFWGGSEEWIELSGAERGLAGGGLPVGGLLVSVGAVGGVCGASVVALFWKCEGALMPICSRQVKSDGVTLPLLLDKPLMIAVTSFLRCPLERVVQGEECVVGTGSDDDMEFCSCSANSSNALGSVEASVGGVDGQGKDGSGAFSEVSFCATWLGFGSLVGGAGSGEVVLEFHWLSGPKSGKKRSRWERWCDDLWGPSVWDAVDADGGSLWVSGCRVVASGSFHRRDCQEWRSRLQAAPEMTVRARPFLSSTTGDVMCRESKSHINGFCIADPTD